MEADSLLKRLIVLNQRGMWRFGKILVQLSMTTSLDGGRLTLGGIGVLNQMGIWRFDESLVQLSMTTSLSDNRSSDLGA